METNELIGTMAKNSLESVRVCITEYKGKIYVDARVWYQEDAAKGEEKPTKKGLCLAPDVMLELLPLLSKAQERAAELAGWKG
jgi:hypothetical protein